MSLLSEAYTQFTVIEETVTADNYGGEVVTWTDGETIEGAIVYNNSTNTKIAQAMGVTGNYTLTVKRAVELDFHTVIRRDSDGKVFRLVTNSDDMKTPASAGLDMRQYTAEEWSLT